MDKIKCRVCFEKAFDIFQIFVESASDSSIERKFNIADMIEQHLGFRPLPNDVTSTSICKDCHGNLRKFHEFYIRVDQIQRLYADAISKDNVNLALPEVEIILDEIKSEPLMEFSWERDSAHTTQELIDRDLSEKVAILNPILVPEDEIAVVIKTEPLRDEEPLDDVESKKFLFTTSTEEENNLDQDCIDDRRKDDSDQNDDNEGKFTSDDDDANSKDENSSDSALLTRSGKRVNTSKSPKSSRKVLKKSKTNSKTSTESPKKEKNKFALKQQQKRVLYNAYAVSDDELIRKHIPFNCGECGHNVKDFLELKEHFSEEHRNEERAYIRCCGRKFSKRQFLVQHAYRHENPEHFKCQECQKVFVNDYALQAHMRGNHPKEEDLKYNCDKCEKRFGRRGLLEMHKASHVPENERRFFCPECPERKAYATNHLLQIHICMVHKRAKNICHVCAKVIRDKDCFRKHVLSHTGETGPRVKCPRPNCDSWLKDADNLKAHLRRHNDEGKIYECKECGKRCQNGRALRSHRHYAHSKAVFTCEECNKSFKRALSLKEHMAKHTGETLYKCPFCERTFNSNANMHSHKKKMHPAEWALLRQSKMGGNPPQPIINDKVSGSSEIHSNIVRITESDVNH